MAKAELNPLLGIRGRVGHLSVARYGDKYIVRRLPERARKPASARQVPVQKALKEAILYWRGLTREAKLAYVVAAQVTGRRAYDLAKADFLHPPRVNDIDATAYTGVTGQCIRILAEDDFEVTAVRVRILDLAGLVLEEGEAELAGEVWSYTTQRALAGAPTVVLEAIAFDHAGHQGLKQVDHFCGPHPAQAA